jgi:hypothetical protein
MVGKVHSRVQRFRHGIPPEEMGGTKLDNNGTAALFTSWPVCYSPRQSRLCNVTGGHIILIHASTLGPGFKQFLEYFKEELKDQAKGKPRDKL